MKYLIFLFISVFLFISRTYADEEVKFSAEAPEVVRAGEQFRLTFTVNADVDDFTSPAIDGFRVLAGPSTSTSTNVSIVNGKMTRSYQLQYTFVLRAEETGDFTIPPAKVEVDGKEYKSNEVDIEVIEGDADESSSKGSESTPANRDEPGGEIDEDDLFVKVIFDKKNVYREEPVVATIKLYSKLNIANLQNVKFPDFKGFYKEEIETPPLRQLKKENVNGEIYGTGVLKKYILFPQRSGEITIDPFQVDCIVQQRVNRQSRSFFDEFFGDNQTVKKSLSSEPVEINVKPLPEDKPVYFTGGVGDFQLEASLDQDQTETDEAVTLKVKISGTGNLKVIDMPVINFPPDLEFYDPKVSTDIKASESGISGVKEYEYPVVPRHEGTYQIPSLRFAYFDLSEERYKTLSTGPMELHALKGEGEERAPGAISDFSKEEVNVIGRDIRYQKTEDIDLKEKDDFLFGSTLFYIVFAGGAFLFVMTFLLQRRRARENANIALAKSRKANRYAKKRLKEAFKYLNDNNKESFYEEILQALWGYVGDKLSIPVSELYRDNAEAKLKQLNVDEELIEQFLRLIDDCEYARYAPADNESKMGGLYQEAITVISQLQQKLKQQKIKA
ncbi:MAG: BatD family protein [Bacteroidales bacterium]